MPSFSSTGATTPKVFLKVFINEPASIFSFAVISGVPRTLRLLHRPSSAPYCLMLSAMPPMPQASPTSAVMVRPPVNPALENRPLAEDLTLLISPASPNTDLNISLKPAINPMVLMTFTKPLPSSPQRPSNKPLKKLPTAEMISPGCFTSSLSALMAIVAMPLAMVPMVLPRPSQLMPLIAPKRTSTTHLPSASQSSSLAKPPRKPIAALNFCTMASPRSEGSTFDNIPLMKSAALMPSWFHLKVFMKPRYASMPFWNLSPSFLPNALASQSSIRPFSFCARSVPAVFHIPFSMASRMSFAQSGNCSTTNEPSVTSSSLLPLPRLDG